MTASNVEAWNARPARSDEPLDLTFVSGSERVIYNASARYRGNWRVYNGPAGSSRCSYAIDFHASDRFLGDNEVKLDMPGQNGADIAIQRERHSSWFASAMGLPASNLRFVRAFFNGSDQSNTRFFRAGMAKLGFNMLPGTHPIAPVMLGDAALAGQFAEAMLEHGVYVIDRGRANAGRCRGRRPLRGRGEATCRRSEPG